MAWVVGILKFIFGFVGIAALGLFIISLISVIINPRFVTNDKGEVIDPTADGRYWLLIITAAALALVIALP